MVNSIDVHVGKKLKVARVLRDMTQCDLGARVGVTLQQVQKYERGLNRVSASRLFAIAKVLGVDISYFYEGLTQSTCEELGSNDDEEGISNTYLAEDDRHFDFSALDHSDAMGIARMYLQIKNQSMRKVISKLIKEVVAEEETQRHPQAVGERS